MAEDKEFTVVHHKEPITKEDIDSGSSKAFDLENMILTSDKKINEHIKEIGYKGCQNCQYQIEPLRGCEWLEQGGDGIVHWICSRWDKREGDN